jgi:hypothetical protein
MSGGNSQQAARIEANPEPLAGNLFGPLLKAGKTLFEHGDGGLNILSANCQNSRSKRIGRVGVVEYPRALLFGGNVVLEKLSASTEIDNQGLDPRFPYGGIISIPKMVPTFHSGYSERSDLEQAGGPGLSIARTAPNPGLTESLSQSLEAGPKLRPDSEISACRLRHPTVPPKPHKPTPSPAAFLDPGRADLARLRPQRCAALNGRIAWLSWLTKWDAPSS